MWTLACLTTLVGCALAARLENTYLPPPGAAQSGGSNLATPFRAPGPEPLRNTYLLPGSLRPGGGPFNSAATNPFSSSGSNNAFGGAASRVGGSQPSQQSLQSLASRQSQQQPTPRPALIIKQLNENAGDGTYTFSYETENGIQAEERGLIREDGAEGLSAVQGAYAFTAPDNNVRYTVTYTADENGFLAYGDHLPTPPPVPAEILRALEQNAADEARGLVDDGQYRAEHHGQQSLQGQYGQSGQSSQSLDGFLRSGGSSGFSGNSKSNGGYRY